MRRFHSTAVLAAALFTSAIAAAACGSSADNTSDSTGTSSGGGGASTNASAGTQTGSTGGSTAQGILTTGSSTEAKLTIEPKDPVVDATGAPATLQFTALLDGEKASGAAWELADVTLGAVSTTGLFTAKGTVAGKVTLVARAGGVEAQTTVTVRVKVTDNAAGVSAEDIAKLEAGGTADPGFKWLYPYDKTVFPRGLEAPLFQFGGGATDATYVRVAFGSYEYKGYFTGSSPARVALPEAVWKGITLSAGGAEDVVVETTKLAGGQVTGPQKISLRVAQGSLKGLVYYNTYASPLANGGAVMRIKPGGTAEKFIGGCAVCHSVSANGNVIASGVSWGDAGNPMDSATFDIATDGSVAQRQLSEEGRKYSFGALTPNGEYLVTNGISPANPLVRGVGGDYPNQLVDTKTGQPVASEGLTENFGYGATPTFAPDGTRFAATVNLGTTLKTTKVDIAANPVKFTEPLELLTVTTGVVGWPSFTPDGLGLLFHEGDRFDTAAYGATPSYGNIRLVDAVTKTVTKLDALNGDDATGASTLPYGPGEEDNLNYEPTVLPVAVGGYYWVYFTSRRAYGNTIAPGGTVPGGDNEWGEFVSGTNQEIPSPRKKLWVAAVDINFQGKLDPSHPAFYLPGQELEAGNMRAFAALEPCKADGGSCESGAECCGGFCRQTGTDEAGQPVLACVPPPANSCSKEDETCATAADCCQDGGPKLLCINGRCAAPNPT